MLQDLTAVHPLAKLQHLTRLELRQHVLVFATYKTVARGVRGSVALQSRTLAGLTRLTSLALPDNTLVGDDAMIVVCMPCLRGEFGCRQQAQKVLLPPPHVCIMA